VASSELTQRLAEMLRETGKAHHRAFVDTDGEDPEWPAWYAEHLQERLAELLKRRLTRSALASFFVLAAEEHPRQAPQMDWPDFYAALLLREYGGGDSDPGEGPGHDERLR
jgi:hypothetical protein